MPNEEDAADQAARDARFSLGASASAGLASLAFTSGSPSAVALGLMPAAANLTRVLVRRSIDRSEVSAARVTQRAAEIVGGLDILEARAESTDERIELVGRVLLAAGRTILTVSVTLKVPQPRAWS